MANLFNMSDVFISYSRKDVAFTRKLFDSFKAQGKEVWADFEDIPKAADWWKEIQAGIDAADSFVFIISPDSVRSDVCRQEVDHAVAKNKRFIPVLYRDVTEAADKDKIHPAISAHNWIFARETDDYETAFETLSEAVNTDLEHHRMSKRLLVRAMDWEGHDRNASYALRGADLEQAQTWLAAAVNKAPPPMQLHSDYITFSRQLQQHQQRRTLTFITGGFVASLVLAAVALVSFFVANTARADALIARDHAQISERHARTIGLAANAIQALDNYKPDLALQLGLQAAALAPDLPQVASSLAEVIYAPGTYKRIRSERVVLRTLYLGTTGRVALAGEGGLLCLHDAATLAELRCLSASDIENRDQTFINDLAANETSTRLLSAARNGVMLWDIDPASATYGERLWAEACPAAGVPDEDCFITNVALSRDGETVFFGTQDGRLGTWQTTDRSFEEQSPRWLNTAELDAAEFTDIALSRSGHRLLTAQRNGAVIHWAVATGELIEVLAYTEPFDEFGIVSPQVSASAVAFSHDGLVGAAGWQDGSIWVWELLGDSDYQEFLGHQDSISEIIFHPNGQEFFSSSWDNSVGRWQISTQANVQWYVGHDGGINSLTFNPDFSSFVSSSYDGEVRLWNTTHPIQRGSLYVESAITSFDYDDESLLLAIGGSDGRVSIFRNARVEENPEPVTVLYSYGEFVVAVRLMQQENLLILYADNQLVRRDLATGRRQWVIDTSDAALGDAIHVHLLADETRALIVYTDGWAVYDMTTREQVGRVALEGLSANIRASVLHPDETQLLVGTDRVTNHLMLMSLETGAVIRTYPGHRDGVTALAFNRDGDHFASGSFDTDIRLWEVETGRNLEVLAAHNDRVSALLFLPGGRMLSGSDDQRVRLWDLEKGVTIYAYSGHTERISYLIVNEDERFFMSSSEDGNLIAWNFPLTLDEMIAWARENRYVRDLRCAERNIYLNETNDCTLIEAEQ